MTSGAAALQVKTCCASAYGSPAARLLLGDTYHPGGLALTRALLAAIDAPAGDPLLDVACGRGASALLAAHTHQLAVTGIDLSPDNVAAAAQASRSLPAAMRPCFRVADAELLPFSDGSFDLVICECAWCTFPDKQAAAAQFARVLRPGGRIGITDVTAAPERLPHGLQGLAATVACVADTRPADHYARLLTEAGFRIQAVTGHDDDALLRLIDRIEARLTLFTMTTGLPGTDPGVDMGTARSLAAAARQAVADGVLGYAMVTATRE